MHSKDGATGGGGADFRTFRQPGTEFAGCGGGGHTSVLRRDGMIAAVGAPRKDTVSFLGASAAAGPTPSCPADSVLNNS
jgi:hypothetical protein